MATVIGNIALLLDLQLPRASVPERKSRPSLLDVVSSLTKKEPQFTSYYAVLGSRGLELDGDVRSHRAVVARGKANSKVNGVDFDAGSSDEDSNGNGEDEEEFDWEREMRRRVKEMEEMKELERKAEELQNRAEEESGEGEGEGEEETEEEKKMRVRKELEKVRLDR